MTDFNAIYGRFISVAIQHVGSRLAPVKVKGSTPRPAIFINNDPRETASYPFITVNISSISDAHSDAVYEYYNEDGDKVTVSTRSLTVVYNIFSSNSSTHRAEQIAFDLKQKFTRKDVLRVFNVDGLGEVTRVFGSPLTSFKRDNEVGEMASLAIIFTVAHAETNTEYEMNTITIPVDLAFTNPSTEVLTQPTTIDLTE